jgi:D-xylulose reductase
MAKKWGSPHFEGTIRYNVKFYYLIVKQEAKTMKALVLEQKDVLSVKDMPIQGKMTSDSVRIAIKNVGICGSDVHYYTHGRIGPYVVNAPMILGHEAAGVVVEVGENVKHLVIGDRVCMEPGIPNAKSRASKIGLYNLDPDVQFWATPPVHGCLIEEVIHPAEFTFKLPDTVSLAEGAMVEPLAIGLQAAKKAAITPGDVAVVIGAGTIGIMCAISAIAGGCSRVFITDIKAEKLAIAGGYPGVTPINVSNQDPLAVVMEATSNWGADIVIEASGAPSVFASLTEYCCPGGRLVLVGIPIDPVPMDIARIQAKELDIASVFRYANIYPRAIELIASGQLDVKKLISDIYPFEKAIEAFGRAKELRPGDVKIQLEL